MLKKVNTNLTDKQIFIVNKKEIFMQKMASKVSNKKDRINEKIKNLKEKCECCGYEGKPGERNFIITDSFPVFDKKIKFTVCEQCFETFNKFNDMVIEKYKKEADQA